jgi:hypothetical protein
LPEPGLTEIQLASLELVQVQPGELHTTQLHAPPADGTGDGREIPADAPTVAIDEGAANSCSALAGLSPGALEYESGAISLDARPPAAQSTPTTNRGSECLAESAWAVIDLPVISDADRRNTKIAKIVAPADLTHKVSRKL